MVLATLRTRRDTAANWTSANPILGLGEEGYETDTGLSKTGNGATTWNSLAYGGPSAFLAYTFAPSGGDDFAALTAVISALTSAGGGIVYLRSGTYLLSDTLEIGNKVVVRGVNRSATILKAHSSFGTGKPLIRLGPAAALSFGSRLERCSVDCNNVTGSIGIYSFQGQEMCGVDFVTISGFKDTGIHFDTGAADFGISNIECYPASTGANYGIHLHNPGSQSVINATTGVSGLLTAGVYINSGEANLHSIHVENCTDGVLFANSRGVANGVSAGTVTANVTNLVRSDNNTRYVTCLDLTKNTATNTMKDDFNARTITDSYIQVYTGTLYVGRLAHNGDLVGFYNTTPIGRQTRPGQLTVAAGTPSTTTTVDVGSSFSQTTLNNQIATLATKINLVETIIHNLGLST